MKYPGDFEKIKTWPNLPPEAVVYSGPLPDWVQKEVNESIDRMGPKGLARFHRDMIRSARGPWYVRFWRWLTR